MQIWKHTTKKPKDDFYLCKVLRLAIFQGFPLGGNLLILCVLRYW